ncbi:Kinesin light chain 3 [Hondaea fermentalgiana]|uniref:Kinesin light chain 3 n=1 Tax=Hondaea fermentalgiana TaxID=2315210 RepID=A0A2R5H031_9STRA|nr:Kinesin light chain 3 [Hondaea fermentalgiana]|eukprot:GBG33664.1 Kinesin light chain 3 [Hondaea fermentalgiana]
MVGLALGEPLISPWRFEELVDTTEKRLETLKRHAGKRSNAEKRLVATRALSLLYLEREELDRCEKLLRKSLSLASKLKGESSLEFKTQLNYLAVMQWKQDKVSDAETMLRDLVASLERHLKRHDGRKGFEQFNELLIRAMFNLAGVLAAKGKRREAAQVEADARSRARAAGVSREEDLASVQLPDSVRSGPDALRGSTRSGQSKRSSFRERISFIVGGRGGGGADSLVDGHSDSMRNSGADFAFSMPGAARRPAQHDQSRHRAAGEESAAMRTPLIDLLDHTAALLADARRTDHIELLFRTALTGSYGALTKVEEQRITVRLALLLGANSEYLDEATGILERALAITEELYGPKDIQVAVVAGDLGTFFAKKGDPERAEALFLRALNIFKNLDRAHRKEEVVYKNYGLLMKTKGQKAKADLIARMTLAIDDDWIFQTSESNVSVEAIARTLRVAIDLEAREKKTPQWYNWHDNERKKSLLAYALEVFRDTSHNWEEILAPKYLRISLEVIRLCGRSTAFVPISGMQHFALEAGGGTGPGASGRATTAESILRAQFQASRLGAVTASSAREAPAPQQAHHSWVSAAAAALFSSPWQAKEQSEVTDDNADDDGGADADTADTADARRRAHLHEDEGNYHDGDNDDDDDDHRDAVLEDPDDTDGEEGDPSGSGHRFSVGALAPPGSAARLLAIDIDQGPEEEEDEFGLGVGLEAARKRNNSKSGKSTTRSRRKDTDRDAGADGESSNKQKKKVKKDRKKKKKKGSIVAALLRRRRDSASQGLVAVASQAKQATGFLRPDLDLEDVLVDFFAEVAPEKSRTAVKALIAQHDGREDMVIASVEAKFLVRFHRDGTWESRFLDTDDLQSAASSGVSRVRGEARQRRSGHHGKAGYKDEDDVAFDGYEEDEDFEEEEDDDDDEEEEEEDDDDDVDDDEEDTDVRSGADASTDVMSYGPSSAASLKRRVETVEDNNDVDLSGTLDPDVPLRETLLRFYEQHVPNRGEKDVDEMLAHFDGRHRALFKALRKKYGVRFLHTGTATFVKAS